jgi:two-component system phosphate regulon sensor histidine kinase PhoR
MPIRRRRKNPQANAMAADDAGSRRALPAFRWLAAAAILTLVIAATQWGEASARTFFDLALILGLAALGFFFVRPGASHALSGDNTAQDMSQDLLTSFLDALSDPAVVLDRDGFVIAFNPAARAVAPGLRLGEPASIGLRIPELVDAIARAVKGKSTERVEFSERIPTERWWEAAIIPVAAAGGVRPFDDGYFLLTLRDLSPVRRVEEMRADFVANASHELRTPLAALSGFIETLKGSARDDPAARERFLNIMESQATRMARLIDDLLSLSRIELNAHLRPDKPVDLLSVIRQVTDALQTLAKDRGVEVSIAAPPAPLIVPGDRDELIRVFENLIENALKYGASGKRVEIMLSHSGTGGQGEAVVAVRDHGPGIAAEHLPRLTERFYRVDVAGSRALGGTGLGLALVKHVLNRHRGRLLVASRAGEGATFTVRLPLSSVDTLSTAIKA